MDNSSKFASIGKGIMTVADPVEKARLEQEWLNLKIDIKKSVIPIYRLGEKGKPVLEGSSFILKIGEEYVLTTAAHVTDIKLKGYELYIPDGATGGIGLPIDERIILTEPPDGNRRRDLFDLSFINLRSDRINHLRTNGFRTIGLDEIYTSIGFPPNYSYAFCGYPSNKTWVDPKSNTIISAHRFYVTLQDTLPPSLPENYDILNKGGHMLLNIRGPFTKDTTGVSTQLGSMFGHSGGPVWQMQNYDDWLIAPQKPQLAGIVQGGLTVDSRESLLVVRAGLILSYIFDK